MGDKKLEMMKENYGSIRIPDTLHATVVKEIERAKAELREEDRKNEKAKLYFFVKRTLMSAATILLMITVMVNSSASLAHAMEKIPVLGAIVRVVTFRQYENSTDYTQAEIAIPKIGTETEENAALEEGTQQINRNVEAYTQELIAMYEAEVAENAEAYLDVVLDYTVLDTNERLFSLRFDQLIARASGEQQVKIYHMDQQTGQVVELKDLFVGDADYVTLISEHIKTQMREGMAADEAVVYWVDDEMEEMNFASIREDQTFYINEAGKLMIVFHEYEAAPGYMGIVEFEIPTEIIEGIVREGFVR